MIWISGAVSFGDAGLGGDGEGIRSGGCGGAAFPGEGASLSGIGGMPQYSHRRPALPGLYAGAVSVCICVSGIEEGRPALHRTCHAAAESPSPPLPPQAPPLSRQTPCHVYVYPELKKEQGLGKEGAQSDFWMNIEFMTDDALSV